jgi:hypothetical protein
VPARFEPDRHVKTIRLPSGCAHHRLENFMDSKHVITALAATLALASFSTAARAEAQDEKSFAAFFKMEQVDKNKDHMVSKAEFLEMMGKRWDMKAKEMKVKGGQMGPTDFEQVLTFMKAGN